MSIMQGDAYGLPITGTGFTVDQLTLIEFAIGPLIKFWKANGTGTVTYDSDSGKFFFPLTQEETFMLQGSVSAQARVKFTSGAEVHGVKMGDIQIQQSISRAVI